MENIIMFNMKDTLFEEFLSLYFKENVSKLTVEDINRAKKHYNVFKEDCYDVILDTKNSEFLQFNTDRGWIFSLFYKEKFPNHGIDNNESLKYGFVQKIFDSILDKIEKQGINSITEEDKEYLNICSLLV